MNTKKNTQKFDIYQMVTDRILEQMEKGVIPWKQPWFNVNDGAFSHTSGKCYSLLNQCMLGDDHEYITYKEIKKENGKLKKDAPKKQVVFWTVGQTAVRDENGNVVKNEDGSDKMKTFPILRYYTVYDIADTEGIKPREKREGKAKNSRKAENVVKNYIRRSGVKLVRNKTSNEAFYSPRTDSITIPMMKQFDETSQYYSTLFHEMTHSTGHKSRLNRLEEPAAFGSESYSREELVAELGAASLTNYCGIENTASFKNSTAYLENWLHALKDDKKLIITASGRAQKAVNLILNIKDEVKAEQSK